MIEVPEGWEIKPFSSLASINMGQSPESEFVNENQEGIAFLQGNADFGDINPKELYWVKVPKKLAKKDDILISVRAPVGDMNMADKEYCIGRGLSALTIKKINQKFGFYALFQERIQLDRLAQGSTFLAIGKNDFDKLLIKYPKEKKEQEKIAKILSTLDNAIESTTRIIEKEKNIKTALMQELLTNGIDKNGQIRTPQTHTYKQSELGLIPDEWEVMSLIDVTDKNNRYSFTGGPFGSDLKSSDYVERGVRVIQLQNIGDGEFKNNDFVYTLEQKAQELFSCQIFPNEIIMSKMGDPVGRACLIPNLEEKFIMCSDGIRIKVDLNKFDNYFIFLAINNTSFRNLIERVALGSTRKRIGLIELKTLKLKLPEFEEQKQIAKILTTQDKRIEMEETNLSKFKELKKGLMNDLLSGVVRVKV
ncbi:MAG: restriction endonuclease subunit S [Aliarcobacter sp.]|nr:restriction endonuclease subunit S [Aliarcobacter sp.]